MQQNAGNALENAQEKIRVWLKRVPNCIVLGDSFR